MSKQRRRFLQAAGLSGGAMVLGGLAAPAWALRQSRQRAPANLRTLKRYLSTHAIAHRALPPLLETPPDIGWAGPLSSGTPATTLADGVLFPITDPRIGGPLRQAYSTQLPGAPRVGNLPCMGIRRTYFCKGMARAVGSPMVLRLRTDAPVIEVQGVVPEGSHTTVTVLVDGQRVPARALSSSRGGPGGWNFGAIRLDFGTRAVRDIWLEALIYPAAIKLDAADTLFPADDGGEPQLTVVGDSYLQAHSAVFGNGGALAMEVAARLGLRKVACDAIGGTGYGNSGGDLGNLNDRLPGHAADASDIYLILAGLNDYGDVRGNHTIDWGTQTGYEAAVGGYLRGLRAARPKALIVVAAPFCPVPPMSDASYVAKPQVNQSGLGDFLYKAEVQRQALMQLPGPWVYIDVLMGGGWINSSGTRGDVTGLQWLTGGTPAPETTASHKPGNTQGGGGGGFGGIARIPVLHGGRYSQGPEITSEGGSGTGLLLSAMIDNSGALTAIRVVSPGSGYESGSGLPKIVIDRRFELSPAELGAPEMMVGTNADGQYPLLSFAPEGATGAELNNIYRYLSDDMIHPSPLGVDYLSARLARNLYDAVLAL